MDFCPNCGSMILPGMTRCGRCGKTISVFEIFQNLEIATPDYYIENRNDLRDDHDEFLKLILNKDKVNFSRNQIMPFFNEIINKANEKFLEHEKETISNEFSEILNSLNDFVNDEKKLEFKSKYIKEYYNYYEDLDMENQINQFNEDFINKNKSDILNNLPNEYISQSQKMKIQKDMDVSFDLDPIIEVHNNHIIEKQNELRNKLYKLNGSIFPLLLKELDISDDKSKEQCINYIITNYSLDFIKDKIETKEKQEMLYKKIKSFNDVSINIFENEFNLENMSEKEEKILFIIENYSFEEINNKIISTEKIKNEYYDYVSGIDDEKLGILCMIYGENDLRYRESKIKFIVKNVPILEFENQYKKLKMLFDLDDEVLNSLFKKFDITSPKLSKSRKIQLLCTYHNFDEIKNAYNECVSDNNTSNNSNLFNEPINQQANKDIEDLIYEFERVFDEKMDYAEHFENQVNNLLNEVNSFESKYLEEYEKTDLVDDIETILENFHWRLSKLDNLKIKLILFKNSLESHSYDELSAEELNDLLNDLNKIKIDIYERRFNKQINAFDALKDKESELEKQVNNKILQYNKLYSDKRNPLRKLLLDCESLEDVINISFKNINNMDTAFVPQEDINQLEEDILNLSNDLKSFYHKINIYLQDLYKFEHLIDDYTEISQFDNAIHSLNTFNDYIDENKLLDYDERFNALISTYDNLCSVEKDFNDLDDFRKEEIYKVNDIFQDDFFNFEIMAYNFSDKDIMNIRYEIIDDIKTKKLDVEIDSGIVIGYFEKYNEDNFNLTEEALSNIINKIDLSVYDPEIIEDSKEMILKYSKDFKMDNDEVRLRFNNILMVKTREKDNLIELNSLFKDSNIVKNAFSLTGDQLNIVYDISKERILNGYKGSIKKLVNDEMNDFNDELKTKARESLEIFYKRSDFYEITRLRGEESGRFINKIEDYIELNEIRSENINKENMVILSKQFSEHKTIEFSDLSLIK